MIYTNDHGPPHVHVKAADGIATMTIPRGSVGSKVLETYGLSQAEVKHMVQLVEQHADQLMERWRQIHEEVAHQ
jgi:hypothetical protein